jgi:hypothetical protein
MMRVAESLEVRWNLEIDVFERGKRRVWHQRTHNIVVNTGRQFICEVITPQSLGPGSFVRTQDEVVRYIGFGIGGARQTSPDAAAAPYSDPYPAGYNGTNTQDDDDVTVTQLERPVLVTNAPLWMKEISTPGTFPSATSTTFVAVFSKTDINFGAFTSVPLAEIALFSSGADPSLPNGAAGAYPGGFGYTLAYDTFDPFHKNGNFTIEVRWTFQL